jgi:HlyD family secretion protein
MREPGPFARIAAFVTLCAALLTAACSKGQPDSFQGYVEGEFVHVGSGAAGRLQHLLVQRGQTVAAAAPLFDLESDQEAAAVRQADEAVSASRAQLADLGTGKRSAEIEVLEAQLAQAKASEQQSASQLARDTAQLDAGGISRQQLEASSAKHDVDAARVREISGQLDVARMAARPAQISAQSSQVAAAAAALDKSRKQLDEKHVVAAQGGVIVDTLFREGEWVPAGSPVVRMLPPENLKVRFFVPQPAVSRFPVGHAVTIRCPGCASPIAGTVTYTSTEPEYTPPVIYSNDTRAKLVFMIEARPDAAAGATLHPGQPVDVRAE